MYGCLHDLVVLSLVAYCVTGSAAPRAPRPVVVRDAEAGNKRVLLFSVQVLSRADLKLSLYMRYDYDSYRDRLRFRVPSQVYCLPHPLILLIRSPCYASQDISMVVGRECVDRIHSSLLGLWPRHRDHSLYMRRGTLSRQ